MTDLTYTVASAFVEARTGKALLCLEEIQVGDGEGWNAAHFRPITHTKTKADDLAHFRKLIAINQRQPERA